MIKIPPFLEKTFSIFTLMFYTKIFALESLFIDSEGELGASSLDYTPLNPLLSLLQHSLALFVILLMVWRWTKTLKSLQKNPFLWLLIILVLISASWSEFPQITQRRSLAFLETCLFAFYFASRYSIQEQLRLTAYALGITASLSFLFGLALPSRALESGIHSGAWRGPFLHKNLFARLMTLSCLVNLLAQPINYLETYIFRLFACISVTLILLSTSKTGLFIVLALLCLIQIYRTLAWPEKWKIPLWLVLVLGGMSLLLYLGFNWESLIIASGLDITLSGRTIIWSAVLDKIQERPWLGYGYLGFWYGLKSPSAYVQKSFGTTYVPPHSHNGFLELAIALG
jgi:O-antigen ligase